MGLHCRRTNTPGLGNVGLKCPSQGTPGLGGTIRVRTNGFRRLVASSLFDEILQAAALTAFEGAGGSKLLLVDDMCYSSTDLR